MNFDRWLDWDGCYNVRDLGGLAAAGGRKTRWGAVVRADSLARLTPVGWAALVGHGVRTVIDLRNDDERAADPTARPDGLTTVSVPLDDSGDTEFWKHLWDKELDGTPLYYPTFLEEKPARCAAAITAIAQAGPGGVAVHCGAGRDRTGLVTLLLLALVGVPAETIADDYLESEPRLGPLYAALGLEDQGPHIADIHARKGITAQDSILATVSSIDFADYLQAAGVTAPDLTALRDRLLD